MWMGFRAGAFALATLGVVCIGDIAPVQAQDVTLTEGKIAHLKSVLRLSPAQEVHWRQLVATLRETIERQQRPDESAGFVQRVKARVGSYVLTAASMQRISMAAQPLIASLDEDQKREGMTVVRSMGVASLF